MIRTWNVWIHLQGFIQRHGQKRAWVDTPQTVTDEARQRVILGQAWVFDRRTVSKRARQRETIQVHNNNPGRGKVFSFVHCLTVLVCDRLIHILLLLWSFCNFPLKCDNFSAFGDAIKFGFIYCNFGKYVIVITVQKDMFLCFHLFLRAQWTQSLFL